jgi:hypothetical protein
MRLTQKLMDEGAELNITGNGGTHYNGVKITEVYDDFIAVEASDSAMRTAGQFRGGESVYVNVASITRMERAGMGSRVQDSIRTRLR